ncbi:MAG: Ig-like domain-containing protein, partial [Rhodoferax sp.]|nr:Ig-like domain-containing protein [Rhodoferax sp.]
MKLPTTCRRLAPWFTPLLLGSLLAACGGGQDPLLGGVAVSAVAPPTVTTVLPGVGATQVALNTQVVTIGFSKPMDAASLAGTSLTLQCPAGGASFSGTLAYNAASNTATVTLPATSSLPANTLCQATLSTAATDSGGVALVAPYTWSFRTSLAVDVTAPTVIATLNANGASNVPTNTRIGATFSEAINGASLGSNQFLVVQTASGTPVTGTLSSSGSGVLFTPTATLLPATQYTVTLKGGATGVSDLAANVMASDYVWKWTTAAIAILTPPPVIPPIVASNPPLVDLAAAAPFGSFGGSAGMTNTGTLTLVNGDMGSTATATTSI